MDKFIISSAVYNVWRERNRRSFQNVSNSDKDVSRIIIDNIIDMLKSIKVKKSSEPSDATYSVVIIYSDDVDAIVLDSRFIGNVARLEEPYMYCEWGYILHNDALLLFSLFHCGLVEWSDDLSVIPLILLRKVRGESSVFVREIL
ncbi:hypothetical protein Tco_0318064 [Tanacetum coccineum]